MKDGFFTDGLDKKDSTFVTLKNKRSVYGGGGITPDIIVDVKKKTDYVNALWRKKLFLKFASIYVPDNLITSPIVITDNMMNDFKNFISNYEIKYQLPGEKELNKLENKLNSYSDGSKSRNLFDKILFWRKTKEERLILGLHKYYEKEKLKQFENPLNINWIRNGLESEMSMIVGGKEEQIKVRLHEDSDYLKAVEVLKDLNKYYNILSENSIEQ